MENKNVHIAVWSIMLTCSLVLGAVTLILFFNLNKQVDELRVDSKEIELKVAKITELNDEIANDETVTFILKNYNGVIGVFDQSGILTDIIDVDIKACPSRTEPCSKQAYGRAPVKSWHPLLKTIPVNF